MLKIMTNFVNKIKEETRMRLFTIFILFIMLSGSYVMCNSKNTHNTKTTYKYLVN